MHLLQEKKFKQQKVDHTLQKQEKDSERKQLQSKIDELLSVNKEQRKKIEDEAWSKIDIIKDQNKEELVQIIDTGCKNKHALTTVQTHYKSNLS